MNDYDRILIEGLTQELKQSNRLKESRCNKNENITVADVCIYLASTGFIIYLLFF